MAGRGQRALAAYRVALDLIETGDRPLPFHAKITDEIARLEAEAAITSD